MTTTIRMRRCGPDHTLDGYIFTNHDHARAWLSQPFVNMDEIVLEEIEVGPLMRCRHCNGTGHRQDTKIVRRLTAEEAKMLHTIEIEIGSTNQ